MKSNMKYHSEQIANKMPRDIFLFYLSVAVIAVSFWLWLIY